MSLALTDKAERAIAIKQESAEVLKKDPKANLEKWLHEHPDKEAAALADGTGSSDGFWYGLTMGGDYFETKEYVHNWEELDRAIALVEEYARLLSKVQFWEF